MVDPHLTRVRWVTFLHGRNHEPLHPLMVKKTNPTTLSEQHHYITHNFLYVFIQQKTFGLIGVYYCHIESSLFSIVERWVIDLVTW